MFSVNTLLEGKFSENTGRTNLYTLERYVRSALTLQWRSMLHLHPTNRVQGLSIYVLRVSANSLSSSSDHAQMDSQLSAQHAKAKPFHGVQENQSFYNAPENQLCQPAAFSYLLLRCSQQLLNNNQSSLALLIL